MKKVIFLSCIIILIVITFFLNNNQTIKIKTFTNNNYTFSYDSNWKLLKQHNKIYLKQQDAQIQFEYQTLNSDNINQSISDLSLEIINQFKHLYDDWTLIAYDDNYIVDYGTFYQLLYEKDNEQLLISIIKDNNRVGIISYYNENNSFDILLDSVIDIINSFRFNDRDDLSKSSIIETDITYLTTDSNIDTDNKKIYDIYNYNYHVKYQIPSAFELQSFDSRTKLYTFNSINLETFIVNKNSYSYMIDSSDEKNLAYQIEQYLPDNSQNLAVECSKKDKGYLYHLTYEMGNHSYEYFYYIVSLDSLHTFVMRLTGIDNNISKEIIDNLTILQSDKYGYNITGATNGSKYLGILKAFISNDKKQYIQIEYQVPLQLYEVDLGNNMDSERIFYYNYNRYDNSYDAKVRLNLLAGYKLDTYIALITNKYQNKADYNLIDNGTIDINNKSFKLITISYFEDDKVIYNEYAIYEGSNYIYTVSIISNQLNPWLLNELLDIEITKKQE